MPNMRRRQLDSMRAYSEDGWSFAQVYWAAIWTLYYAGCIDGEVHRVSPGHDSSPIPGWHTEAASDALTLGFVDSVAFLPLSFLCRLTLSMGTEVGLWQFNDAYVSDSIPCFMENPVRTINAFRVQSSCCSRWQKPAATAYLCKLTTCFLRQF
jgi:hypothetical protein